MATLIALLVGMVIGWVLNGTVLVERRYNRFVRLQRRYGERWWVRLMGNIG